MEDVATDQITAFTPRAREVILRILILGSIALFFIFSVWSQSDHPLFVRAGAIGLAFVLTSICVFEAIKAIRGQQRILTLKPEGFIDTNVAPELVPWAAVEGMKIVSTSFRGRQRLVAVEVKIRDSAWDGLTLSRSAKFNKHQTDGMWIARIGRESDFPTFFQTMRSYARAHGGKVD